jgi:hypothetical protein
MAAAAAESFRLAARAPAGLKAHTLTLASGQGPAAIAHRTAVLGRTGSFGQHGFPKPAPNAGGKARLLQDGAKGRLRSSQERQAAVAVGVLLAVAIAAAAVALADNTQHITLASGKPPGSASGPASAAAVPAAVPGKGTGPASVSPAGPSASKPSTAVPTPTTLAPTPTSATAGPTAAPTTASPTPAPTRPPAPGTLVVTPSGGPLEISQSGVSITLTATGGPVNWSIAVSGARSQHVHVSPSSGTLASGASVPVTITVDHTATGGSLTVSPGGTVFTIVMSNQQAAD